MDKEVRCPWCEGKDMTLNDINREPVELVYEYHCRECIHLPRKTNGYPFLKGTWRLPYQRRGCEGSLLYHQIAAA